MNRYIALAAAILGFTSVLLGTLGAHALPKTLDAHYLDVWKTAAQYQGLHAVALLALAAWKSEKKWVNWAALCFVLGILVFSGSLYVLVLTQVKWLGAITPIGGVLLMGGWTMVGISAFKKELIP